MTSAPPELGGIGSGKVAELIIRPYRRPDEAHVIDLWMRSGITVPWNDPRADIERKLSEEPDLFLVGEDAIVATCMAGYDGHRGWIYYLCVNKGHRRLGYAGKIMGRCRKKTAGQRLPQNRPDGAQNQHRGDRLLQKARLFAG